MTKEEFKKAGAKLWGGWGWNQKAAERFSVCDRTIRYWVSGKYPVPDIVAELIKNDLAKLKKGKKNDTKSRK